MAKRTAIGNPGGNGRPSIRYRNDGGTESPNITGLRAVVTGGAGFLGLHLCERLLIDGAKVVCIDNFVTGRVSNVAHLLNWPQFHLMDCDVTERVKVDGDVNLVFHFASLASPADFLRLPVKTLKTAGIGTLNALDFTNSKRAKLVLASTSEVYGDPLRHPQPEDYNGNVNPVGPRSGYDEGKRFAEAATVEFQKSYGVDIAIARIFNSHGPRLRPDDGRVIPTFICRALLGKPLVITGNGRQTRSFCYVDDTVEGLMALARSDQSGPVNIGSSYEMTILELAASIRDLSRSSSPIEFVERPVDDPSARRPETGKARPGNCATGRHV